MIAILNKKQNACYSKNEKSNGEELQEHHQARKCKQIVKEGRAIPGITRVNSTLHLCGYWLSSVPDSSKYLDGRTIVSMSDYPKSTLLYKITSAAHIPLMVSKTI